MYRYNETTIGTTVWQIEGKRKEGQVRKVDILWKDDINNGFVFVFVLLGRQYHAIFSDTQYNYKKDFLAL